MLLLYVITAAAVSAVIRFSRKRSATDVAAGVFYTVQAAVAVWMYLCGGGMTQAVYFTFDEAGRLFFALMAVVAPLVFLQGRRYLDTEKQGSYNLYNILSVLLCVAMSGVYLSNNLAVTWIMLEVTTLCTAGLVYHRRTGRSLEAAWKYVFVCSTGIAMAYLGIMLIGATVSGGDLSYGHLAALISSGNPLYLKIAFLFILVGYSSKMEIFPLYNAGVDANLAAPSPASALISTGLVNAGFLSLYRVYKLVEGTEVFGWVSNVLVITGLFSLLVGVLFLRRTNNYKRLLSYSTVENMGIAAVGLGIGGPGVYAALLHVVGHTLVKSSMFMQIGRAGKTYGTYRINRMGGFMGYDRGGAVAIMATAAMLMAFPPSPLFISEIAIMGGALASGRWWIAAVMLVCVCVALYSVMARIIRLCYDRPRGRRVAVLGAGSLAVAVLLAVVAAVLGALNPGFIGNVINSIAVQI